MTDNFKYQSIQPLQPVAPATKPQNANNANKVNANSATFNQLLTQELGVKFSQHALQRMESRKIQLDNDQMSKLNQAVDKAAQKGAKEALILMDSALALVVSVKNRTVITAVDGANIKDNVFTNIDSAVII